MLWLRLEVVDDQVDSQILVRVVACCRWTLLELERPLCQLEQAVFRVA